MARNFTASSSMGLYCNDAVLSAANPLTISVWFYQKTAANSGLVWIGDKDSASNYTYLSLGSDKNIYAISRNPSSAYAFTTSIFTLNTWTHACGVWLSDSSRAVYRNAGAKGTNASASTPNAIDRIAIGYAAMSSPTEYANTILADVAVWNVALSDAEVALLANGMRPTAIRAGNLAAYYPLAGHSGYEHNYMGRYPLTPLNAPTRADDPPQLWKPSKRLYTFNGPVAAGYNLPSKMAYYRRMRAA